MAVAAAVAGDRDMAFAYLERAFAQEDGDLIDCPGYPSMDPTRSDSHYKDLMRRLGLPEWTCRLNIVGSSYDVAFSNPGYPRLSTQVGSNFRSSLMTSAKHPWPHRLWGKVVSNWVCQVGSYRLTQDITASKNQTNPFKRRHRLPWFYLLKGSCRSRSAVARRRQLLDSKEHGIS